MFIRKTKFALLTSSLAAFSLTITTLLFTSTVATSAVTYSVPAAPKVMSTSATSQGVRVSWEWPGKTNPPITNYIVSGGAGSCPVIVPANYRVAYLPVMAGSTTITPTVQAVNAYGISPTATGSAVTGKATSNSNIKSVQILQLSDFHGAIEASTTNIGAAVLAAAFDADRAKVKSTITVSSGDNIGAAPAISSQFEELPTIEAMNAMKFDVSGFGNHEHDQNLDHLKKVMAASNFGWVASNYNTLAPLKTGKNPAKSFIIVEKDGVKIGLVGINSSRTVDQVFPGNLSFTSNGKKRDLVISNNADGANKAATKARAAGADLVVALVHQGWNQNLNGEASGDLIDYAKALKNVDVVYGGDSHQTYRSVVDGKLTVQVRNSGLEYSRTQVCVNTETNRVLGASVEHVTKAAVANITPDAATTALVAKYKTQLNAKLDVKIGTVSDRFPRGGTPPVERSGETPLGTYTADLLLAKYKTDFALVNGGGIRDTLPANTYTPADKTLKRPGAGTSGPYDVTLGDAYTVFPFGNTISVVNVTGANLWAALENGVSRWPTDGRFPHVAGLKFTFDTTKPAGSRVSNVVKSNGTPIAKDATVYSIATIDFLVYGGDGYTQFDATKQQLRDLLVDVFAEGLRADLAAGRVTQMPKPEGRITVIK